MIYLLLDSIFANAYLITYGILYLIFCIFAIIKPHTVPLLLEQKEKGDFMKYYDTFSTEWQAHFSHCKLSRLVEYEDIISRFIDSDFYPEFPLSDEVMELYRLVQNECVRRCATMSGLIERKEELFSRGLADCEE